MQAEVAEAEAADAEMADADVALAAVAEAGAAEAKAAAAEAGLSEAGVATGVRFADEERRMSRAECVGGKEPSGDRRERMCTPVGESACAESAPGPVEEAAYIGSH